MKTGVAFAGTDAIEKPEAFRKERGQAANATFMQRVKLSNVRHFQ